MSKTTIPIQKEVFNALTALSATGEWASVTTGALVAAMCHKSGLSTGEIKTLLRKHSEPGGMLEVFHLRDIGWYIEPFCNNNKVSV